MRIDVVCVTYFFCVQRRNPGKHQYKYHDENGYLLTSSIEKINEDGTKSLINEREIMEKSGNITSIIRTKEETIIDQKNSSIINTIYTRVVEDIDANNPNKSTYESYQSESNPNSKKSDLNGNALPTIKIFEPQELRPQIPVGGSKLDLPRKELSFTDYNQIPTAAPSDGYEARPKQAGGISGANSPQSASGAGSSQLNLEREMNGANLHQYTPGQERHQSYPAHHNQVPRPETRSRSIAPSQPTDRMSGAHLPQHTPGQERLQSDPAQYNQVPRPVTRSKSRVLSQQTDGMGGLNLHQYTPEQELPQWYSPQYNQLPRPETPSRSIALSQQTHWMSGANLLQYSPEQDRVQLHPPQYNQVPRPEAHSRSRAPSQQTH
ncbi:conserved hypothetical protein [Cotesia vestalis bracovirus]|nr:conserved hypothetical protein [Cotesia vestalis bracovirus]